MVVSHLGRLVLRLSAADHGRLSSLVVVQINESIRPTALHAALRLLVVSVLGCPMSHRRVRRDIRLVEILLYASAPMAASHLDQFHALESLGMDRHRPAPLERAVVAKDRLSPHLPSCDHLPALPVRDECSRP